MSAAESGGVGQTGSGACRCLNAISDSSLRSSPRYGFTGGHLRCSFKRTLRCPYRACHSVFKVLPCGWRWPRNVGSFGLRLRPIPAGKKLIWRRAQADQSCSGTARRQLALQRRGVAWLRWRWIWRHRGGTGFTSFTRMSAIANLDGWATGCCSSRC